MVTAQAGDSQAYRQLLAIIVIRSMEACAPAISRQELDAADVDEFVGRVLQMVHAALATFDPRHSIDIWLLAIISVQLEQSKRQHRAGLQATGARAIASWYRRLLKQI
jgi:hypothetical protein